MSKAKTHEQFIDEIKDLPLEIISGIYKGNKIKLTFRCKKCNHEWEAVPSSILSGKGCPTCAHVKNTQNKSKTHEQFVEEIRSRSFKLIRGIYINNKTKLTFKCDIDGHEWTTTADIVLRGSGCPKCGNTLMKSHEQFLDDIKYRQFKLIEGTYRGNKTKLKFKCDIDGHEWWAIPTNIINNNHGCPKCANTMKKDHEEFLNIISGKSFKLIQGTYDNNITKLKFKCDIDGHEWWTTPSSIINSNTGCPKCAKVSKYSHEEFLKRIEKYPFKLVEGTFVDVVTKLKFKCNIDGHEWWAIPNNILSKNQGCPLCNKSHGELAIKSFLEDKHLKYIHEHTFPDCKNIKLLPFDFYLPDLNILIEFDGEQHYRPVSFGSTHPQKALKNFEDNKLRDSIKNEYCIKNNIKLIRIPYWDIKNIDSILTKELYIINDK